MSIRKTQRKVARRNRIRRSIRRKISGTPQRPRMSVFRSNKAIYVQIIDDSVGHTLAFASSAEKALANEKGTKTEIASKVGEAIASKAIAAGVTNVVFDRGGYLYHGRVKAMVEGARKGGLKI